MSYMAVVGGVASIAGGLFGSSSAKKAARAAAREKARLQKKLNNLEENRQEVINPYEDVKSLSSMISNPFANLSVATQAAEMKIEEADISLANTLDTMRATGASAGGATALAQAALKSKKGVSASIEAQEKANEDKRARGQQFMEQRAVAEAERVQDADVSGREFVYTEQEKREQQQHRAQRSHMLLIELQALVRIEDHQDDHPDHHRRENLLKQLLADIDSQLCPDNAADQCRHSTEESQLGREDALLFETAYRHNILTKDRDPVGAVGYRCRQTHKNQ